MRPFTILCLLASLGGGALPARGKGEEAKKPSLPPGTTPVEERLGKEAEKELLKIFQVVKNPEMERKLKAIVDKLAAVSPRPKVKYTVKIVVPKKGKKDDVNAFSLPGGRIFVTEGLLRMARSDHELAAVLAHEMMHNIHLHALQQLRAAKRAAQWGLLGAAGLSILTGGGDKVIHAIMTADLVITAILNEGYSQKFEAEADKGAIDLCLKAGYNPVGLVTFLERLVAMEEAHPKIEWGIYRTHPPTRERISLLIQELIARGIEINRRAVTKSLVASARKAKVDGREAGEVLLGREVVFKPVVPKGKEGPFERAKRYAKTINSLLLANLRAFELRKRLSPDGTGLIMARGRVLVEILPGDAKILGKTVKQLCEEAMRALKRAFIRERAQEMLFTDSK
ncbi:MAG TPA: hypothetical protein EYP65_07420 [Armatimonadetes bacterium]|nr:hypothetical protein [Armatimonadota bacterium]